MKWKSHKEDPYTRAEMTKKQKRDWHKWFAWYPIEIGDHEYWIEVVERKWVRQSPTSPLGSFWRYRKPTLSDS